ncbi:MAG TPA: hypothetical protein VFC68_06310 [Treponemataceae bacterium]|nr:hypothetical protein [Treponemataceae bacterium]
MKENTVKKTKDLSQKVYTTLLEQNDLLENIIALQKIVYSAVTDKKWETIEDSMHTLSVVSEKFQFLEKTRVQLCNELCPENAGNMHSVADALFPPLKTPFIQTFHEVRQKLTVSKIENKAINDYIRISQDFLQGVMENVIPQRRNKIYTRTGTLVKNQPDSVVLNTYM